MLLQARDRGLFTAITDCGAGGFSSAVGEMGAELGATVRSRQGAAQVRGPVLHRDLDHRVAGADGPGRAAGEAGRNCKQLCDSEDVEATVLGTFEATGRLKLRYHGNTVADLDMHFLHDGRPTVVRNAESERELPPSRGCADGRRSLDSAARRRKRRFSTILSPLLRLLQGMDHPPVRPRGAGRQRHQAAGRRRERRPVRRRGGHAGARLVGRRGGRLRHQPALRRPRPVPDGRRRDRRGGAQRRRRRRRPGAHRPPRQLLLGQRQRPGGARLARPRRRGVPRRRARLRHAVHQRQGQPEQHLRRQDRRAARHPAHAARLSARPRAGRAPVRDDGPEGSRATSSTSSAPRRTNWAARTYHLVTGQTGGDVPRVDLRTGPAGLRGGSRGDHRAGWCARATT